MGLVLGIGYVGVVYEDNGKEHGNYYIIRGYIGEFPKLASHRRTMKGESNGKQSGKLNSNWDI